MNYKTCILCKTEKPVSDFYLYQRGGPRSYCKKCDSIKAAKWAKENKGRRSEIRKKHYVLHKDDYAHLHKKYYLKNKERIVERERIRRHSNPRFYAMIKRAQVWKKFGASYELFNTLLRRQDNRCDLCGSEFGTGNKPQFDHNHTTMKARGLLCVKCNTNLPYIENEDFLNKARSYLKKHNEAGDKEPL